MRVLKALLALNTHHRIAIINYLVAARQPSSLKAIALYRAVPQATRAVRIPDNRP